VKSVITPTRRMGRAELGFSSAHPNFAGEAASILKTDLL
jgi:hypothetical protein